MCPNDYGHHFEQKRYFVRKSGEQMTVRYNGRRRAGDPYRSIN